MKDEVKKFQHDFFTGQFERFEELLTEHFYHQATRLFDLENSGYSPTFVLSYCCQVSKLNSFTHAQKQLSSKKISVQGDDPINKPYRT